jgi:hypothetical protein
MKKEQEKNEKKAEHHPKCNSDHPGKSLSFKRKLFGR